MFLICNALLIYIDDTKCVKFIHSSTDINLVQNDIDYLFNWSYIWGWLSTYLDRFTYIPGKVRYHWTITPSLNLTDISSPSTVKELRFTFSSNLNWDK